MINPADIASWRLQAPWSSNEQVEQDLILSRALVEIFQDPALSKALLLRGGTALHKLFVASPQRYSEDIDLVQVAPGPIGSVLDALRSRLDPILGVPRRENNPFNVTLRYRMQSEIPPVVPMRLKVEINTREHFVLLGPASRPFAVRSPWFEGEAQVQTYALEELLATKLRALYQRRKGRDLFDLWLFLKAGQVDPQKLVQTFRKYMEAEGAQVSRRVFEQNFQAKLVSRPFNDDLRPLLAPAVHYDPAEAARLVMEKIVPLM